MGTVNHKLISEILRRKDQEQRDRAEQERRKLGLRNSLRLKNVVLGTFWAARSNKDVTLGPDTGCQMKNYVRPHPSDAGRKRLRSPAGQVADKGRKWGGCLPGSFETLGKR